VIASSLVTANKYVTASTCYNMRVVECRLAAVILAKHLRLPWTEIKILKQVQHYSKLSLSELQDAALKHLHKEPYTIDEVAKLLEEEVSDIRKIYLGTVPSNSVFELQKRALHVYSESNRVYQFQNVCNKSPYPSQLEDLGQLMNESHQSCSAWFGCSCPELDTLTATCRKAGAFGSRLTGAGWGGCTVSLVLADKLDAFFEIVKKEYYVNELKMDIKDVDSNVLFATIPGSGAAVYYPKTTGH